MILKADLHLHTEASHDGRHSLQRMVRAAKAAGLDAIAVTEHNLYQEKPAELEGILLIPACELSTEAGHITALFIKELPAFEGLPSAEEAITAIHRCGGLAILAHPFQSPARKEETLPSAVDGVETANARAALKVKDANQRAAAFAEKHGLTVIGGSDAHGIEEVGNAYTLLVCTERSLPAVEQALRSGKTEAVLQKNAKFRHKGLSQWKRRSREGKWLLGFCYYCYSILRRK